MIFVELTTTVFSLYTGTLLSEYSTLLFKISSVKLT